MKMRFCTNCGHRIPADSKFCPICGTTLKPDVKPDDTSSQPSEPVKQNTSATTPVTNQSNPMSTSFYKNSYMATLIGWIDFIVDDVVLCILGYKFIHGQNIRPFNQSQPNHPLENKLAGLGNDADQLINSIYSPQYLGHHFIWWIILLAVVSGALFFILRRKQSKVLNWCLIIITIVLIVVAIDLFIAMKENNDIFSVIYDMIQSFL